LPDVTVAQAEVETPEAALTELRRTRRRNRLADVHWIDALYRVYIVGFLGVIAVALGADALPGEAVTAAEATTFAADAPAWLGLGIAVAVAIGIRSGARGGPLVLEAPVVMHELNAPVDRAAVLRRPAIKQLRFLAFSGAVVGALAGELGSQRLPVNGFALAASGAVVFGLAGMLASGAAMVVSGRRIGWWPANGLAILLLGWSVLDGVLGTTTSPFTWLASGALWPVTFTPLAIAGAVLAIAVAVLGVAGIGRLSTEHALRRASLVAQLRFAVTLQDVRTVVLLRRQLSQEKPRAKPWVRLRRRPVRPGTAPWITIWKRDWHSYLRFPLVRVLRMLVLAVVAGLALGVVWRGTPAAVLVAGLALFVAAYDAAEPVAQEVDHPTRWESYPDEPGRLLTYHLYAAFLVMVVLCLVAGAAALVLVPLEVVLGLLPVVIVPVAGAAALAAIISTAQGAPDSAALVGLGPDVMGWVMIARLVLPPALVVITLLPLLGAGSDAAAVDSARVGNTTAWVFLPIIAAFMYLRTRKPKHL
jgi:hypothetical protein